MKAEITKLYLCINCNGRIPAEDGNDSEMVRCPSCHQMMLTSFLTATLSANLFISNENGEISLSRK